MRNSSEEQRGFTVFGTTRNLLGVEGIPGVEMLSLEVRLDQSVNACVDAGQISEYDPWRKRASEVRHKWEESLPEPTLVAECVLRIIESKSPRLAL